MSDEMLEAMIKANYESAKEIAGDSNFGYWARVRDRFKKAVERIEKSKQKQEQET